MDKGKVPAYLEIFYWVVLALIVSSKPFFAHLGKMPIPFILDKFFIYILLGVLFLLFPYVFQLIFGRLPFAEVAHLFRGSAVTPVVLPANTATEVPSGPIVSIKDEYQYFDLMRANVMSSKELADRIFRRAGVYLLIGTLIAISGMVFFYFQTAPIRDLSGEIYSLPPLREKPSKDMLIFNLVTTVAPRIGILFFIEVIAFFFLRLYRGAMDEFRYFEAIKRSREDLQAMVYLQKSEGVVDVSEILRGKYFLSHSGRLAAGETTEILEARKLTRDELVLFEKLVDLFAARK